MIICSPTACEFKERKHFSIVNNCSFIIDLWKAPKLLIIPNKLIMTYFKSGSSSIAVYVHWQHYLSVFHNIKIHHHKHFLDFDF